VLVGMGSALSLLVAITATAACCITYVVHTGTARIAGALQLTAGELRLLSRSCSDFANGLLLTVHR
jgi:hypothetical protein